MDSQEDWLYNQAEDERLARATQRAQQPAGGGAATFGGGTTLQLSGRGTASQPYEFEDLEDNAAGGAFVT